MKIPTSLNSRGTIFDGLTESLMADYQLSRPIDLTPPPRTTYRVPVIFRVLPEDAPRIHLTEATDRKSI